MDSDTRAIAPVLSLLSRSPSISPVPSALASSAHSLSLRLQVSDFSTAHLNVFIRLSTFTPVSASPFQGLVSILLLQDYAAFDRMYQCLIFFVSISVVRRAGVVAWWRRVMIWGRGARYATDLYFTALTPLCAGYMSLDRGFRWLAHTLIVWLLAFFVSNGLCNEGMGLSRSAC